MKILSGGRPGARGAMMIWLLLSTSSLQKL